LRQYTRGMSDVVAVVLGVLALLGLVAAVVAAWKAQGLMVERGELLARVAKAEEGRQGLVEDVARAERAVEAEKREADARLRELQARLDAVIKDADELRVLEAQQREKVAGSEAARVREQQSVARQQQLIEQKWSEQLEEIRRQSGETFKALAGTTLAEARNELMKIAEEKFKGQTTIAQQEIEARKQAVERLLSPISETLKKTDEKLAAIEKERTESYAALRTQVQSMAQASEQLRGETGKLVKALREPHVRGRYGEIQLKRVAELAGMTGYCDFNTQDQTTDGDGNALKPDMVVRLPSERVVVVDAKTNIQAYLDALQAETPELQEQCLDRFARHVADQARALSSKKYWTRYEGSPEFVVMFIPGDQFIDAALSRRPEILEEAARQNVLLASPSTLIGLLRAVAVGYGEQRLAAEAATLRELGKELHERASAAFEHVAKLGKAIESAGDHFNNFVGSYERRLEPTLRKFEEANVKGAKELPELKPVATQLRLPSA